MSKKRHNPFLRVNSVSRAMGALEGRPPVSSRGERVGFPEDPDPGGEASQGRVVSSVPSGSCLQYHIVSPLPFSLVLLSTLFT